MPVSKITNASNNIVYLDFDGTLTGAEGRKVIGTDLCVKLSTASSVEERAQFKEQYQTSDESHKITKEAKAFLNAMNALHPHVNIVIVSRNYENYIKALLEFEGIDTTYITIYPRSLGNALGPGEDKYAAIIKHERDVNPGLRFIADDFEVDYGEMRRAAHDSGKNVVIGENAQPGRFSWEAQKIQIFEKIRHILPVSEYLKGSTTNRFHLFSANTDSSTAAFKEKYKDMVGDDLKRALLNELKIVISKISSEDELRAFKTEYKKSPEYQTLAKGQGLITRLFRLQTDSQRAVESIFKNREEQLKGVTDSPRANAS